MASLQDYLPDYYDDIDEMKKLMAAESATFTTIEDLLTRLLMNQFVTQADSAGLSLFESQLEIEVDPDATIETRRYNILMRILPPKAITLRYFKQLVEAMQIPATIDVDAINSRVQTYSDANVITAEQIERLRYLLNVYLPANLGYQISKQDGTKIVLNLNVGFANHTVIKNSIGAVEIEF